MTEEKMLKNPNLVQMIVDEVHKQFCGETDTIKALIVSINTRLVKGCHPESRNIVLSEMSGAGKDRLVGILCNIMLEPEVTYFHRSKLTPEVFTYWHKGHEEWNWDGKVLHIEDPPPELLVCHSFKTIASGERSSTVVIKQKAIDIYIKGKPNMIITTYEGCTSTEGVRRFPFVHMNTSDELTSEVIDKALDSYVDQAEPEPNIELREALGKLQPFEVVIPFAKDLREFFPNLLVMRTYIHRFLEYIASSTVLHQYQRERNEDGKLIATLEDYDLGRIAFLKTCSDHTILPLNRDQLNLLEVVASAKGNPMFVSDIHKKIPKNRDWIYRNLEVLKRYELVEQGEEFKDSANRMTRTYCYTGGLSGVVGRLYFPSTERLSGCIACRRKARKNEKEEDSIILNHHNTNKCNTTNLLEQSDNHHTRQYNHVLIDDAIRKFGGRRENDEAYSPTQRWLSMMLKKLSSGSITEKERYDLQRYVKDVISGKEE